MEDRKKQAEEERIKKEEAEKKKKEEQDRKKKEDEQKKKDGEEKKKAEAEDEKKEQDRDRKAEFKEKAWTLVDRLLKPAEDAMDSVLGKTIDPFTGKSSLTTGSGTEVALLSHLTHLISTSLPVVHPLIDRRYIAWLSLVTLAFNYNTWFITARLCFPYHTESAIPYWFAMDMLADLIYLTDSVFFQARKQFVKGGDIIVGLLQCHLMESVTSAVNYCTHE